MSRKANRFKVMGGLLVLAMAMFAVLAGQASATTWTTKVQMKTGTKMEIGAKAGGATHSIFLKGTVSGLKVELTAHEVAAVAPTNIVQTGEGASGVATATGALKYTELTLLSPAGCTAPASVTTRALKGELIPAAGLASGRGIKLQPSSTTEPTLFATVTLGGECAIAGTPFKVTIPTTTFFCGEVEPLGTMLEQQPITTSAAISEKCGGTLEAGSTPASLTGTATGFSKEEVGGTWGAQ